MGTIVYLTLPDTNPISALTTNDGSWVITLSAAANATLTDYTQYDEETAPIDILVQGETQIAKALTLSAADNPVPDITLGQTYDFREEAVAQAIQEEPEEEIEEEMEEEKGAIPETFVQTPSQFPTEPLATPSATATPSAQVVLSNPQEEGETVSTKVTSVRGIG